MEGKIDVFQGRVETQFSEAPCLLYLLMRLIAILRSFAERFAVSAAVPEPSERVQADVAEGAQVETTVLSDSRARSGRCKRVVCASPALVQSDAIDPPARIFMTDASRRDYAGVVGIVRIFSKNSLSAPMLLHAHIVTIC